MKIECVKEKIKNILSLLDRITGKQLSLPILSFVYCEAKKNTLILRATNLDLGVEIQIPTKTTQEGSCLLPAQLISNTLSPISFENIILSSENDQIFITTPKHNIIVKGFVGTDDFPELPKIEKGVTLEIQTKQFINGMKSVLYAAAPTEIKPEIASVYFYTTKEHLIFVSTDGFRLAEKKILFTSLDEIQAIIPYKNALEIIRLLDNTEYDQLSITITTTQCIFHSSSITISSRLITGVYPDYPQLIPHSFLTEVSVSKEEILSALKVTNLFCDSSNQIMISIHPTDSLVEIGARNSSIGENIITIDGTIKGEDIDVFYNIRYLNEFFQSITTPRVVFGFNSKTKPGVLKGEGDTTFTYLVMPVNR
ncbi:MAG: DNA polymerase III subunit beta [Candidatus Roizmanbacteria bacterium]|nr:DNA polymerase III subunit beta [Candidatus Roizmanbacteria bacterium]